MDKFSEGSSYRSCCDEEKSDLPDGDTRLKHGDILIILRTEKDLEINFL
jgi:Trk K+ transport system NAD-binding subunit